MATTYKKNQNFNDSRVEWIGQCPEGWQAKKLKYLGTLDNSGIFGDEAVGDIEARLATTAQLSLSGKWFIERMKNRFFTKEEYKKYQTKAGDIIVVKSSGSSTNIISGKAGYISPREAGIVFSNFLLRIKPHSIVNSKFLFYFLVSHITKKRVELMCSSTTYPNLKVWEYISALIPFPSTETQKRIADFLDEKTKTIDEVIEKKQKLIELLKEQRTAIITKAVTKGLDSKAKMKDSGVEWVGKISTNWVVKKIKHIASINRHALSEKETAFDYEFKYVDIGNVNNRGEIVHLQDYTFGNAPSRARRVAENGDVILSTVRTYLRSMARVQNAENLVFSTGFAILHPEGIRDSFLFWAMQSESFLSKVMSESVGIHYPGINQYNLSAIKIGVPPEREQCKISLYLDKALKPIDQRVSKISKQLNKLKEYRASLIYNVVTGKITI